MSKKRSTRNTNKSLKALKRKQYARGGRSAVQSQRELVEQQQKKPVKTSLKPKVDSSLYSDPNLGRATSGGGMDNPKDIKLPEPSRSTGGTRGQPKGNANTIKKVQATVPPPIQQLQPIGTGVPASDVPAFDPRRNSGIAGGIKGQQMELANINNQEQVNIRQQAQGDGGTSYLPETPNFNEQARFNSLEGLKNLSDLMGQPQQAQAQDAVRQTSMPQSQQSQAQDTVRRTSMPQFEKEQAEAVAARRPFGRKDERYNPGDQYSDPIRTGGDDTGPSGGPEDKVTLVGLDGKEYSSNAALEAANARYLAAQEATEAANTKGSVTPPEGKDAPIGIDVKGPTADLRQMESESIFKAVPESEQWADKYVEQYPEWSETQKAEARAWAIEAKESKDGTAQMPSWLADSDFIKGFEAANNMKYDTSKTIAPEGTVTGADDIQKLGDATDATADTVTARELDTAQGDVDIADVGPETKEAERYEAELAGTLDPTKAAEGEVTKEAVAGGGQEAEATEADLTRRDTAAEEAAKGKFADRPVYTDYATAAQSDKRYEVVEANDPEVAKRNAQTMSQREQKDLLDIVSTEGVNLDDIPEYSLAATRVAQVGEAKTKIANELGNAPSVDLEGRQAITGEAPKGDASQIGGVPTMAASSMQAVTGEARTTAAADMMAVVANMPTEITAAVAQDPASVEAQLDSGTDPQTVAAVAALPVEALVSTQMEGLLAGMEDGQTPAWARPAVAAMEAKMAQRGLSTSTVGRDALFNAIIQSALPIAQSNAQALQQRAQQKLSNEQQANLSTAQNTMQVRMQNLSNRQTAASQSAEMAQQIKVQQSTFDQQAVMTTAQQQQETNLANAQMAQQRAQQESSQRQQTAMANLSTGAQMDLANLQALNAAGAQNLSAEQQATLSSYNAKIARTMRQAELSQDMEKANLSGELQVEMANLAERNAAAKDTMTAEQTERLTNLNTLVDFKKTNASLAQQMDLANLNNEQQMELANLSERAATDAANFTEANRMKLQYLTVYTNMMAKNEDLRQNAEMAQLSASEKVQLANLTFENQADSESMSAENLAQLQIYEKKMQAGQVNAQLAQQMGLANLSNQQSAAMFNAQMNANLDVAAMSNEQQMELANSKFMQSMTATKFSADQQTALQNATALTQVDLANADARTRVSVENAKNFLTMDMANLSNEQQAIVMDQQLAQQRLLSDQAATNAAKQFGATSQNQIDQFMISQSNSMKQFNTSARNAMESFNVTEANRMEAIEAGNTLQADSLTAQLEADISKFNASIDNQRDQWNAANAQAVEQSNVNWRRQANTIDTAAANAANQQNVQNAYNISALDQTQMWQQLRDEAAYIRQAYENNEQREATLIATAIGNESGAGEDAGTTTLSLLNLIKNYSGSSTSNNSGGNRGGGSNSGGRNTGQNDNPQEQSK